MWIGLIIAGYLAGLVLLLRFLHLIHQCDEEIDSMESDLLNNKNSVAKLRSAA
jgi:hypothetical protein